MSRLAEPETLFEYGDWKIVGVPGYEEVFDEAFHKCPWKANWLLKHKGISVYNMDKSGFCPHCGTTIPEEFLGVWKLKNFDNLQKLHQAENQWKAMGPMFYGSMPSTKAATTSFYAQPVAIFTYTPSKPAGTGKP